MILGVSEILFKKRSLFGAAPFFKVKMCEAKFSRHWKLMSQRELRDQTNSVNLAIQINKKVFQIIEIILHLLHKNQITLNFLFHYFTLFQWFPIWHYCNLHDQRPFQGLIRPFSTSSYGYLYPSGTFTIESLTFKRKVVLSVMVWAPWKRPVGHVNCNSVKWSCKSIKAWKSWQQLDSNSELCFFLKFDWSNHLWRFV